MKIHTAVLNQHRLMSLLLFFPDSLVLLTPPLSLPPHQHSRSPRHPQEGDGVVSLARFASVLPFPCPPLTPSQLKVKPHRAAAGANRLLSELEVNSEGAATHSTPFDPNPPHAGTTEEETDKMDDRPQMRGQVQGHAERRRRRWWKRVGALQFVGGGRVEDEVWMEFRFQGSPPPLYPKWSPLRR